MANVKSFMIDYFETGQTLYCLIRREADQYLLDDSDGTFSASPVSPYVSLTENGTLIKRYELSESRTAWNNGAYTVMAFKQSGGAPNLTNDSLIGSGGMSIFNDNEVFLPSAEQIDDQLSAIHGDGQWGSALTGFVKFNMFEYKGDVGNTFSISSGSFVGSIKFYTVSLINFISDPNNPPLTSQICTLSSADVMSDTSGLSTDGDLIFFTLVGFEALENVIIAYYNDYLKTTTYFFIPKYIETITASMPYYPTVMGNLFGPVSSSYAAPLTDSFINKNIADLDDIDFDRLSQPLVVTQPTIFANNIVRLIIIRDRTIDLQFNLHRNVAGDSIYFAMKTDKKNDFYDVEPIVCTIDNAKKGYISVTIPEDSTVNLKISKYYGELMRKTASGKFQTLVMFDVDLIPEIISSGDVQ